MMTVPSTPTTMPATMPASDESRYDSLMRSTSSSWYWQIANQSELEGEACFSGQLDVFRMT